VTFSFARRGDRYGGREAGGARTAVAQQTHLARLKALSTNWKLSTVIHRDPSPQDTARMVAQQQRRARVEAVACHIALLENSSNVRALTGDILAWREKFTACMCVCVCVVRMYTCKDVCAPAYTCILICVYINTFLYEYICICMYTCTCI